MRGGSHATRLGTLLAFAPESQFKLLSGSDNLTEFKFNKHLIDHKFCAT